MRYPVRPVAGRSRHPVVRQDEGRPVCRRHRWCGDEPMPPGRQNIPHRQQCQHAVRPQTEHDGVVDSAPDTYRRRDVPPHAGPRPEQGGRTLCAHRLAWCRQRGHRIHERQPHHVRCPRAGVRPWLRRDRHGNLRRGADSHGEGARGHGASRERRTQRPDRLHGDATTSNRPERGVHAPAP